MNEKPRVNSTLRLIGLSVAIPGLFYWLLLICDVVKKESGLWVFLSFVAAGLLTCLVSKYTSRPCIHIGSDTNGATLRKSGRNIN